MEVAFGAAAARQLTNIIPSEPELQPHVDQPSPLKLVIRETLVRQTNIFWGETSQTVGELRKVESKYYPNGQALDAIGTGGTFRQTECNRIAAVTHHRQFEHLTLSELRGALQMD